MATKDNEKNTAKKAASGKPEASPEAKAAKKQANAAEKQTASKATGSTPDGSTPKATAKGSPKPHLQFWVLISLLVVGVFLLNVVVTLLAQRANTSIDLTANAVFKLDDATKDFLQKLDHDVDIYVLGSEDSFLADSYLIQAQKIFEQYPRLSNRVNLHYVDYVSDPTFASRFPDLALEQGNVVVASGQRHKRIKISELFNYTVSNDGNLVITSSRAEEALTSAIINVISDDRVKVALLTGNGALAPPALTQVLTDNNYELAEVNLSTMELDATFTFALLVAPQTDYTDNDLKKLDEFLYNGGQYGRTLFYTADVNQPPLPNLEGFLKEWGVAVGDGVVFETDSARTFQNQPYYPVVDYVDPTFKNMLIDPSSPMLMPLSRPLSLVFEARDNNVTTVLAEFPASAGVRPSDAPDTFRGSEAKIWGPMPAMVLASKRVVTDGKITGQSNIIISASTMMLDQKHFFSTSLTNSEYLMNIFNTISQRTDVVNIRPKSMAGQALTITTQQAISIGIMLFVVVPLAILATGIVVWLRRRYK